MGWQISYGVFTMIHFKPRYYSAGVERHRFSGFGMRTAERLGGVFRCFRKMSRVLEPPCESLMSRSP